MLQSGSLKEMRDFQDLEVNFIKIIQFKNLKKITQGLRTYFWFFDDFLKIYKSLKNLNFKKIIFIFLKKIDKGWKINFSFVIFLIQVSLPLQTNHNIQNILTSKNFKI